MSQQLMSKSMKCNQQTRQYVSGECHFYLGRHYVLKIIKVKKEDLEYNAF